jgi:hypothetical protein
MWEEREEGSIMAGEMDTSLEKGEVGPTSIDVKDERLSTVETPLAEPQEEQKVQEQNTQIEQPQEDSKIRKSKQRKRITSYLSNISKQVEKQGNQINKMTLMIQSLHKQKQTKPTVDSRTGKSQFQSMIQIKSQVNQLQKQVTRIQDDIRRIRTASVAETGARTRTKFRKRASVTSAKSSPKKIKLSKSIQSGKLKRTAKKRMKKFK